MGFEKSMTWKETNSLALQLRYAYAANRKSTMPVYVDVCGMAKDSQTRGHLEKVEGFPHKWVGRAFQCYEGMLEEVYGNGQNDSAGTRAVDDDKKCEEMAKDQAAATSNNDDDSNNASRDKQPSHPTLPPDHQFVFLTGDSSNTLTRLDNNTTYIIGGIVDRNRLKRAAINRASSIAGTHPALNIKTARLPLDEHVNFKSATRVLTCNHVFDILLKYRENKYRDWRGSIMAVLPFRKDLEEKTSTEPREEIPIKALDAGEKDESINGGA